MKPRKPQEATIRVRVRRTAMTPTPVRFEKSDLARIDAVRARLPHADRSFIVRIALRIGLDALEKDTAAAVAQGLGMVAPGKGDASES